MPDRKNKLDIFYVDKKYIRDLSNVDDNVLSVSPQSGKDSRPFIGIVIIMDNKEYCIPLTSPKSKFDVKTHEDFIKIPDPKLKTPEGAPVTIGILNINNMIPVSASFLQKVDLSERSELDCKRRKLLLKEIKWCRENYDLICRKANKLYIKVTVTPDKDRKLTARCLKFVLLEKLLQKRIRNVGQLNIESGVTVQKKEHIASEANISPFRKMLNERLAKANAPKQAQTQPTKQPGKKRKK